MHGFADLHNHQFAYLGFGGFAFHGRAFGPLRDALPWCDIDRSTVLPLSKHGPGGTGDIIGNVLKWMYGGSPVGHHVGGYPEFDGWPRWDSITHQAVHEQWLFRALKGGLRLIVVLAVNSEFLCGLANRTLSCDDMDAVDRQLAEAFEMEAYIDAKYGGPGQGWYRIVRSAAEAQATISAGKLAVVLGIEVDYLFNCRPDTAMTAGDVITMLDRYYDLGVRHVFPVHFADNGFGGSAFQNALQDDTIPGFPPKPYVIFTEDARQYGYEYRGGRRNLRGLTDLGRVLVGEMIDRRMIIDIDHMSARTKSDTLDICEHRTYPVVSGHSGYVDVSRGDKRHEGQLLRNELERIYDLGGMTAPIVRQGKVDEVVSWRNSSRTFVPHTCGSSSSTFVQAYLYASYIAGGAPVALGTDFNGFAGLPGPRFGPESCPGGGSSAPTDELLTYPFVAAATGAVMSRSVIGNRTFDMNYDGLPHVGMLPDFIADMGALGLNRADLEPILSSAEGYVRLWRRAEGGDASSPWNSLLLQNG